MTPSLRFILTPEDLAAHVASQVGLVLFDGRPGSGKSHMARMMAERLGCTFLDGDSFIELGQKKFVGALKIEHLRNAVDRAQSGPTLLATVCAREVIRQIDRAATSVVWVEPASQIRLDQIRRDYVDHDDNSDRGRSHALYREVEAYIAKYNARQSADVVYMNAPD